MHRFALPSLLALAALFSASLLATADGPPAGTPPQAPPAPAQPASLTVTVPTYPNTTCPIMGRPASLALFADTPSHGRIYICCAGCTGKIMRDPERAYQAAYPVAKKAGNTVCPVTDRALGADAVSVFLQGYEVRVCATCAQEAQANSQIVLAKALNPRIVEVRNRLCPVTGQPVAANAFCVIGTELVHLSSPKVLEEVKKDPARYLGAAKENAARQGVGAAPGSPAGRPAR